MGMTTRQLLNVNRDLSSGEAVLKSGRRRKIRVIRLAMRL
jgi:hypothetical protein